MIPMIRLTMGLRASSFSLCVPRAIGAILFYLVAASASATSAASGKAPDTPEVQAEVQYDITVRIDPVARKIEGRTIITANTPEELTLMLGRRFEGMHARIDDSTLGSAATTGNLRGWRIL